MQVLPVVTVLSAFSATLRFNIARSGFDLPHGHSWLAKAESEAKHTLGQPVKPDSPRRCTATVFLENGVPALPFKLASLRWRCTEACDCTAGWSP